MNYGGFWLRVVAYIIDAIILNIVGAIIGAVLGVGIGAGAAMSGMGGEAAATGGGLIGGLVGLVLGWLYFALMESSGKQATLGKMALGLTVTDLDGQRIGFGRATGRYFAKILSAVILLIGFIMIAFTERKQGLHDMLASTLVLKARPGEAVQSSAVFE